MMINRTPLLLAIVVGVSACTSGEEERPEHDATVEAATIVAIETVPVSAVLEAAGVARPYAEATLSTKLMGTITEVRVREGDAVAAGQPLLVIDARDLAARRSQIDASLAEAEAMRREAQSHAERMRALYAEQAAPKAQLDAAETALARADAAVRAAHAGAAELHAVTDYAVVRAPFNGVVVRRMVDPGAFAAPGAPLLMIQDARRLRVTVTASPEAVRTLQRGAALEAAIEGRPARAVVEGVVPVGGGSVYAVNALVDNATGEHLAGSAATLSLPQGSRDAIMIPVTALRREGDLTGVRIRVGERDELRWVRLGRVRGDSAEVLSGLRDGEQLVVPAGIARGS